MEIKKVAVIYTDFSEKFGIPRQSGMIDTAATIVFEAEFRDPDAIRGLSEYSHLWLLWGFSEIEQDKWRPTVRPPRLGGNRKMGVFATRSPYRPNPIGLSSVKLESVEYRKSCGAVLHVRGADLLDGTPIYDIKPYLSFTDSHPEAKCGFADQTLWRSLQVHCPDVLCRMIPSEKREALVSVLSQDPRPSYQRDPSRIYGMAFAGYEIKFRVDGEDLFVEQIERISE